MASDQDQADRIEACAIADNLESYDSLIAAMQSSFGNNWGGLDIADAVPVLSSNHVEQMDFVVIAVHGDNPANTQNVKSIVDLAKSKGLSTILVTREVSSAALHELLSSGADGFVPYPIPNGAFEAAIAQARPAPQAPAAPAPVAPAPQPMAVEPQPAAMPLEQPQAAPAPQPQLVPQPQAVPEPVAPAPIDPSQNPTVVAMPQVAATPTPPVAQQPVAAADPVPFQAPAVVPPTTGRDGIVLPVYPLAGGVGASTFAANLAWELQLLVEKDNKRVCVLDFAFQYGSISTYLDVARSDSALELFQNIEAVDEASFEQAVQLHNSKLATFVAPIDAVPLEIFEPSDIGKMIDLARSLYDYVIIDMPNVLTSWTEVVLDRSHLFLAMLELEMRSAQNALRFLRALKADDLPYEKVQFIINRAPKRTDLNGRGRIKRMSDSLNVEFRWLLPDGAKQVTQSCDQGVPLAVTAGRNPLRKEIRKIAVNLTELTSSSEDVKASA